MNGILLIDKPSGWTSFDVVNYVRRMVANHEGKKPKHVKVGHTGTLDPLATGLLVLLLGEYTKRAQDVSKLDKTYEVTMRLGETSTTGDAEGEITLFPGYDPGNRPTLGKVEHVLQKFTGEIMQTPPAYSAVKINGQRAYKLARAGKAVEIEPRKITVYSILLTAYSYPEVRFVAKVSSGTYIRALVEDIGKELGTGAYMSDLRRTKVAQFDLNAAHPVNENNLLEHLFTV
jgi:tRNA pseudouridine55 synthase